MVDLLGLIDLQTISMVSAAIGILIGILNWIKKSGVAEKQRQIEIETRQAQLFIELYNRLNDKEFNSDWWKVYNQEWKDYDDFLRKNIANSTVDSIMVFFKGIGVLVKRKLIDPVLVSEMMASYILMIWDKYGSMMKEFRERTNRPEVLEHIDYLYEETKKIYKQRHGHEWLPQHPELAP